MTTASPITLDRSTRAGNPTGASISVLRHARHYPKPLLLWLGAVTAITVAALLVSWWILCLIVPGLLYPWIYWVHVKERFTHGDANPGLVVRTNPTLVAVRTDLTKGFGSYPAVKVIRTNLRRSMGRPVQAGGLLPTVAVYQRMPDPDSPHWWDFDPRPFEAATADRETLDRVMASFAPEECEGLKAVVHELPGIEPGLYRLTEEGWKRFEGFSVRAFRRATQTFDLPLLAPEQSGAASVISWLTKAGDRITLPRFTFVTASIVLLCLSGAIGLAMHLGMLWMVPGGPDRSTWRIVFILGGASLVQLLLGILIGAVHIRRKYTDPNERAEKRRRFIVAVVAFTLSLIAERWTAWSPSTHPWLHPFFELITAVGILNFANTVHTVLLRVNEQPARVSDSG